MFEFKMPSMGADMENGILVQWNYGVGDRVEKGDIICEIETAKGNIDVEIWESGVIRELLVEPGSKIPVGDVMARLETGEGAVEGAPAVEPEQAAPSEPEPVEAEAPAAVEQRPAPEGEPTGAPVSADETRKQPPARAPGVGATDGPIASPAARRRAAELGMQLEGLTGSGPDGAIKLEDVERASAPAGRTHHRVTPVARRMAAESGVDTDAIEATGPHDTVTKADVERELDARPAAQGPASGQEALREAIAKAMSRSKREIPHYYLRAVADVTEAIQWMNAENEARSVRERLVFGALATRAVALAAREMPEMNGFFVDGRYEPSDAVHVGFAVAMRGGGVVAPAIHDTDAKSLDETMDAIKDVVRRVRGGKLRSSEMTDPTITVTNLGDLGVDTVFGIIYPPQVAIVGVGSPREIPVATEGMVGVRTCVDLTLSGDHRVSDGLIGAKFLQQIEHHLQNPEET
jgi:pyruvate dehydrogenase E2 component (dihydrolipoamide acetyltransferase)